MPLTFQQARGAVQIIDKVCQNIESPLEMPDAEFPTYYNDGVLCIVTNLQGRGIVYFVRRDPWVKVLDIVVSSESFIETVYIEGAWIQYLQHLGILANERIAATASAKAEAQTQAVASSTYDNISAAAAAAQAAQIEAANPVRIVTFSNRADGQKKLGPLYKLGLRVQGFQCIELSNGGVYCVVIMA